MCACACMCECACVCVCVMCYFVANYIAIIFATSMELTVCLDGKTKVHA